MLSTPSKKELTHKLAKEKSAVLPGTAKSSDNHDNGHHTSNASAKFKLAAVKAKSIGSAYQRCRLIVLIWYVELQQGASSGSRLAPTLRPGAVSEKISTKPLEYDKSSPLKKNQSAKSVRFDPETLVHSPDHTASGKLKKASMQVVAATSKMKEQASLS